jgi:hypothetical protein
MKKLAAILVCALTFAAVAPSTASAGDVDKWVRMGLSIASNARTANKFLQNANGNNNGNTLLGRALQNQQQNQQKPRLFLRRR